MAGRDNRLKDIPASVLLIILLLAQPAVGASAPAAGVAEQIGRLEVRFFEHRYRSDSLDERLDRLEKMVFGETRSGSVQNRLANLQSAVSEADGGLTPTSERSAPAGDRAPASGAPQGNAATALPPTGPSNAEAGTDRQAAGLPAPEVTYEMGDTVPFVNGPAGGDLPREGSWQEDQPAASGSPAGASEEGPEAYGAGGGDGAAPASQQESYSSASHERRGLPHEVSRLEQQVLGRTYRGALVQRVRRLEESVFPGERPEDQVPLPERVARLWAAVDLSTPPQGRAAAQGKAAGGSDHQAEPASGKRRHPILSGIAKAVVAVGKLAGEAAGAVGTGLMYGSMYGGMYGGYGYSPFGYGGYGYSPFGYGGYGYSPFGYGYSPFRYGGLGLGSFYF